MGTIDTGKKIRAFDVLRVIGLVFVLGYHLFPNLLKGGFVGVDIFFVCSGYLTTALMLKEYADSGKVRLGAFFKRRAKRLFPALAVAVIFALALSLLISPDFRVDIGRQALAAVTGTTNYFEVFTGQSYENQLLPHLFVHTWALAAEMQYYVVWGALLFALSRIFGKKKDFRKVSLAAMGAAVVLGAASYAVMRAYLPDFAEGADPAKAYFSTESRFFSLMVGSFAGIAAGVRLPYRLERLREKKPFKPIAVLAAALAAGALFGAALSMRYNEESAYIYGMAATAVIASVAAVLLRLADLPVLGGKPKAALDFLSTRSYGVYIYHWPLYIIMKQMTDNAVAAALVTIFASFALADVSFRFVEPIIIGIFRKRFNGGAKALTAVVAALFVCAAFSVGTAPAMTSIEADLEEGRLLIASMRNDGDVDVDGDETAGNDGEAVSGSPLVSRLGDAADVPGAAMPYTDMPENDGSETPPESDAAESAASTEAPPTQSAGNDAETAEVALPLTQTAPPTTAPPVTDDNGSQGTAAPTTGSEPTADVQPTQPAYYNMPDGVLIVGDSVTEGAASSLYEFIPGCTVDAKVSRDIRAGLNLLADLDANGRLGKVIVIALASNNINRLTCDRASEIVERFGEGRYIVFVTGYGQDVMTPVAEYLRDLAGTHKNVAVADWALAVAEHRDWLYSDNVHIKSKSGKYLYARLIWEAIAELQRGDAPAEPEPSDEAPADAAQEPPAESETTADNSVSSENNVDTENDIIVVTDPEAAPLPTE